MRYYKSLTLHLEEVGLGLDGGASESDHAQKLARERGYKQKVKRWSLRFVQRALGALGLDASDVTYHTLALLLQPGSDLHARALDKLTKFKKAVGLGRRTRKILLMWVLVGVWHAVTAWE